MLKYVVGFIVLFVLILYVSFVGLNKTAPLVKTTATAQEVQRESMNNAPEMNSESVVKKPQETTANEQVSFSAPKKVMVGGAEVEWVEPDTLMGEGEFGTPPE